MAETINDVQTAYPEELSIFEKPIRNLGVKQARCITYYPVNDFSSQGVLQFRVPNNGRAYLDLRKTRLNVTCKIVRKDGSNLRSPPFTSKKHKTEGSNTEEKTETDTETATETDTKADTEDLDGDLCGVVNNFMQSLFSRVDISLQDKILTNSDDCYPYEAYIKTVLMTSKEEKQGLQSQCYFEEDGDSIEFVNWFFSPKDSSINMRSKLFQNSREVDLSGHIYSSVMDIPKLIPNGIPLSITLYPSQDKFCLLSPMLDPIPEYRVIITKASLSVCTVDIAPEIAIAHSEIMSDKPAFFSYNKTEVKKFTLSKGIYSSSINDPFQGRIPSELVIGLVKDSAQNGSYGKTPFLFEHTNLNFIGVTVDGKPMGIDPLQPKYGDKPEDGNYIEAYKTLNGISGGDKVNPISRLDYPGGFALYRFHEEFDSDDSLLPKRSGNMSISLRFDKALENGMCVIVYATFPGGIKVDKSRAVYEI